MQTILASGFKSDELFIISTAAAGKGYRFIEAENDIVDKVTKCGEPVVVLLGIHEKSDIRLLKRLAADAPQHIYACGIDYTNRSLVYMGGFLKDVPVFFLPPEENEVKKVLSVIGESIRLKKAESVVFKGLKNSKQEFEWETGKLEISLTCKYLADLLCRAGLYGDTTETDNAALAIEEALVNSIEHGSLELDSSLRPKSILDEDKYELLRDERLKDDKYAGRKIRINVIIDSEAGSVSIEDEGPGFDVSGVKDFTAETDVNDEDIIDVSGKGFSLIKRAFDEIEYEKRGRVIWLKKFRN